MANKAGIPKLLKLTKHEVCMALAEYGAGPPTRPTYQEDFNSEYENYFEDWLTAYVFVKMLGPNDALYMVVVHDDEGPNPYESECACFAHFMFNGDKLTMRWAEWPPAM